MCMLVLIADRWWVFFFKQKTAYEMRISDWSSDVCSSDLRGLCGRAEQAEDAHGLITGEPEMMCQGHGMIVHAGDDDTTREVTAAIPSPDPPVVYEVREQQAGEAIAEPQRNPREEHRFAGRKAQVRESGNTQTGRETCGERGGQQG